MASAFSARAVKSGGSWRTLLFEAMMSPRAYVPQDFLPQAIQTCLKASEIATCPIARSAISGLTGAAFAFCEKMNIIADVIKVQAVIPSYFHLVGMPEYEVVQESGPEDGYLAIHIKAIGTPESLLENGLALSGHLRKIIEQEKLDHIAVVYHAV
ncbi:hypothetical protein [Aquisphaera giovannonii]|uniref:hypothetical protein n=1 Tax=Aquisphaera giovannonii TaxID=406548 RepID=UPI001AEF4A66|nr:hypothetical protein [Aquisphaera giovannonii]